LCGTWCAVPDRPLAVPSLVGLARSPGMIKAGLRLARPSNLPVRPCSGRVISVVVQAGKDSLAEMARYSGGVVFPFRAYFGDQLAKHTVKLLMSNQSLILCLSLFGQVLLSVSDAILPSMFALTHLLYMHVPYVLGDKSGSTN
jgi:hypothetical protein